MRGTTLMIQILLGILIGVSVLVCWIHSVKKQSGQFRNIMNVVIVFGILFASSLLVSYFYQPLSVMEDVETKICGVIEKLRYGSDAKDGKYLVLCAEEKGIFYLRGKIGVAYDGNEWAEYLSDVDEKYEGIQTYLKENLFYPQNQMVRAVKQDEYEENKITIQNVGTSRKYIYAPLSVLLDETTFAMNSSHEIDRLTGDTFFGETDYTFSTLSLKEKEEVELLMDENATNQERSYETVFRAYVYDNYLALPDSVRESFLKKNLQTVGGTSQKEVLDSVRTYLLEMEGLTSEAYATEAVLLLRYCGIPARYVSGFRVSYQQPMKEYSVTKRDSHQWAEVYLDGVGFVTFETDPAYLSKTATSVTEVVRTETKTNVQEAVPESRRTQKHIWMKVLIMILIIMLTILLLSAFYLKTKKKKYLYSKNMLEFVSFLCIHLENVLKYDNVWIDVKRPYLYQGVIIRHYGMDMYRSYIRFIHYTDEVQFHQMQLSETQQEEMRLIIRKFEIHALTHLNPIRRWWIACR